MQYADYACWQREWLQGGVVEKQMAHWKQQLQGAPPVLELPTDYVRPAVQSFRGASRTFLLDQTTSAGLQHLGRQQRATLFMVLLAGFKAWLYRYTGQNDLLVGTPVAGRSHGQSEKLIGFFVNTLVLRTGADADPSFLKLLGRVRARLAIASLIILALSFTAIPVAALHGS